jgi:hypothetical protein
MARETVVHIARVRDYLTELVSEPPRGSLTQNKIEHMMWRIKLGLVESVSIWLPKEPAWR